MVGHKLKDRQKVKSLILLMVCAFILTSIISSFAETMRYIYDDLNCLIQVDYGNGTAVEYSYDEVGNRLQKGAISVPVTTAKLKILDIWAR